MSSVVAADVPQAPPMIVTREEWDEFVARPPSQRPELPTVSELRRMSQMERRRFDRARRHHHLNFGPLDTFHVRRVRELGMEQIEFNANSLASAKVGLVVDGDAMYGKTTAVLDLGKRYDRGMRRRYPSRITAYGHDHIPVVYVSVGGNTTIKGLNNAILKFLGHPRLDGGADATIPIIQDYTRWCAITLIIIDDIHHINVRYKEHEALAKHLKHLTSTTGATFVYAGVDCEATSILSGSSGATRSTAGRCELYHVTPYSRKRAIDRKRWLADLAGHEQELALLDAPRGMLVDLEDYLFERTGGVLGTLSELVRKAANRAIATETERITPELLDSVRLNHGSPRPDADR